MFRSRLAARLVSLVVPVAAAAPATALEALEVRTADGSRVSPPDSVEAALDSLRRMYGIPGLLAAWAEGDGRVRTVALGTTAPGGGAPMPESARMLAGSIGKSFVATTVLALRAEGALALDDPIERWVGDRPWFDSLDHGSEMTLRHLLNHTAGIADHVHDPEFARVWAARRAAAEAAPDPDLMIAMVAEDPALFVPGQGWSYSDTGYLILGLIVEAATGRPLFDEVRARLLEPLGLEHTSPSDHPDLDGLVAGWVDPANPFGLPRSTLDSAGVMRWDPGIEGAGGGLVSTPADLVRWARALFSGEALDTPYLEDLLRGVPTHPGDDRALDDRVLYGAGVSMRLGGVRGPVFGHAGSVPGYLSTLRHYPRHGVTLAIQLNTDGPFAGAVSGGADAGEVLAALEEAMASRLIAPPRPPIESPAQSPIGVTPQARPSGIMKVQAPSPTSPELTMSATPSTARDDATVYRLVVRGRVGEGWREWFGADALRPGDATTEIVVRVADQAELLGRLRRVVDLDLQLVELALLRPSGSKARAPDPLSKTDNIDPDFTGGTS